MTRLHRLYGNLLNRRYSAVNVVDDIDDPEGVELSVPTTYPSGEEPDAQHGFPEMDFGRMKRIEGQLEYDPVLQDAIEEEFGQGINTGEDLSQNARDFHEMYKQDVNSEGQHASNARFTKYIDRNGSIYLLSNASSGRNVYKVHGMRRKDLKNESILKSDVHISQLMFVGPHEIEIVKWRNISIDDLMHISRNSSPAKLFSDIQYTPIDMNFILSEYRDMVRRGESIRTYGSDKRLFEGSRPQFTPAFYNRVTDDLIVSPGHHDIDMLPYGGELGVVWIDGFIDTSGKFYTRSEAAMAMGMAPGNKLLSEDLIKRSEDLDDREAVGLIEGPAVDENKYSDSFGRADMAIPRSRSLVSQKVVQDPVLQDAIHEEFAYGQSGGDDVSDLAPVTDGLHDVSMNSKTQILCHAAVDGVNYLVLMSFGDKRYDIVRYEGPIENAHGFSLCAYIEETNDGELKAFIYDHTRYVFTNETFKKFLGLTNKDFIDIPADDGQFSAIIKALVYETENFSREYIDEYVLINNPRVAMLSQMF